jgi:hypothetical protein
MTRSEFAITVLGRAADINAEEIVPPARLNGQPQRALVRVGLWLLGVPR